MTIYNFADDYCGHHFCAKFTSHRIDVLGLKDWRWKHRFLWNIGACLSYYTESHLKDHENLKSHINIVISISKLSLSLFVTTQCMCVCMYTHTHTKRLAFLWQKLNVLCLQDRTSNIGNCYFSKLSFPCISDSIHLLKPTNCTDWLVLVNKYIGICYIISHV